MGKQNQNRYVTKGINKKVPLELQLFCWTCLDEQCRKKTVEMDYLQIFEVSYSMGSKQVTISHKQEKPYFSVGHQICLKDEIREKFVKKIWVIDDGYAQTMLLPEEY